MEFSALTKSGLKNLVGNNLQINTDYPDLASYGYLSSATWTTFLLPPDGFVSDVSKTWSYLFTLTLLPLTLQTTAFLSLAGTIQ